MQLSVERTYRKFLDLVVEGRGMTLEQADEIGQGRVWTGTHALDHGLIDAIGGLDDAIDSAALLADIEDYEVVFMEKKLSPQDQFLQQILQASASLLPGSLALLPVMPFELQMLSKIARAPGVYLQCLACNVTF